MQQLITVALVGGLVLAPAPPAQTEKAHHVLATTVEPSEKSPGAALALAIGSTVGLSGVGYGMCILGSLSHDESGVIVAGMTFAPVKNPRRG